MPKKKIDDYIMLPVKKHEDEEYIKNLSFSRIKEMSEQDMPVYQTTPLEDREDEEPSNEEE